LNSPHNLFTGHVEQGWTSHGTLIETGTRVAICLNCDHLRGLMNAYQITGTHGLDSLDSTELSTPQPGLGEVRVGIGAVSLNFRDYMNVMGLHGVTGPIPRIPCSDGAGVIEACGEGVLGWKPGDRVVCPFMPSWLDGPFSAYHSARALGGAVDGLLRRSAILPASALLPIPAYLSVQEAASLPCAGVTAWDALVVRGQLKPGETVLVLGSGGVSVFSLQIAKLVGAKVLAISSSAEKCEKLLAMGADAVHNYRTDPNWDDWALSQTDGVGVDKVVEIGGPDTLNRSIKATRFGGHISLIGLLTGTAGSVQTVQLLRKGIRLDGTYVGSRQMFSEMLRAFEQSQVHPVIDSVFPFEQAKDAFSHLASGKHFGKIVIEF
jgi:NADPH:quinone reductase-like Zn-dependent oxidoreductase